MFQALTATTDEQPSFKMETLTMESQTDDLELTKKPQSLSGGDFVSNNTCTTTRIHYATPKSTCDSDYKTENEQQETSESDRKQRPSYAHKLGSQLKVELSRYKQELRDYNDTTKHLEKKYKRINTELNEMQMKHERFLAKRNATSINTDDDVSFGSVGIRTTHSSDYSLQPKYTKIFDSKTLALDHNSDGQYHIRTIESTQLKKNKHIFSTPRLNEYCALRTRTASSIHLKRRIQRKFIEDSDNLDLKLNTSETAGLKNIYKALNNVMHTQHNQKDVCNKFILSKNDLSALCNIKEIDMQQLQGMLNELQTEQTKSHSLIQQQQKCLQDYHNRCLAAQQIVQTQKQKIDNLHHDNAKLESDFTTSIEQLRVKVDAKLREFASLPKMVRQEREKTDKTTRDNKALSDRLRVMQQEATQLRQKLEELTKRKCAALARLRAAERDLKIFKNHNTALKNEKKRLLEELGKVREELIANNNSNKRTMCRQRDQFEKQRRELQKRIYELEMKLNRSQKSTTGIIQERDKVIAELQTQLNSLVHNFEVSQKHIRVLRRHIYSMPNGNENVSPVGRPNVIATKVNAARGSRI